MTAVVACPLTIYTLQ